MSDADRQVGAPRPRRERPVRDLIGHQSAVGNYDFGSVIGSNDAGPDSNLLDLTRHSRTPRKFHGVPDIDPALVLQDQSGGKVVDDGLQPEANAQAKRTGEHVESGQFYSRTRQG